MKRDILVVGSLGVLLVALAGVSLVGHSVPSAGAMALVHQGVRQMQRNIITEPPGVSAIQVSRRVTDPSQAAYGRPEVAQYLASNPGLLRSVPGSRSPQLGTVEFISASQASARLNGEPIGRPNDVLVCWVEILGPLDVSNSISLPAVEKASPSTISPAAKEILVFDAQTGNLLLSTFSN